MILFINLIIINAIMKKYFYCISMLKDYMRKYSFFCILISIFICSALSFHLLIKYTEETIILRNIFTIISLVEIF